MNGFDSLGKALIILGIVLVVIGALFLLSGRIPFIGRLPGDILIGRKDFTFYFPVVMSIILSVVLTLIFRFFGRR